MSPSPTTLPTPYALYTLASLLVPRFSRPVPSCGPLYLLFPLPGTLFPQTSYGGSFSPFRTQPTCHLLREALPDPLKSSSNPTPRYSLSHPQSVYITAFFYNLKLSVSLFVYLYNAYAHRLELHENRWIQS